MGNSPESATMAARGNKPDLARNSSPTAGGMHTTPSNKPKRSKWPISARLMSGEVLQMIRRSSAIPSDSSVLVDNPCSPEAEALHAHPANIETPLCPFLPIYRQIHRQSRRPHTTPPPNAASTRIPAEAGGFWPRRQPLPESPISYGSCPHSSRIRARVKQEVRRETQEDRGQGSGVRGQGCRVPSEKWRVQGEVFPQIQGCRKFCMDHNSAMRCSSHSG
jgi:hypothetical protein